MGYKEIFAIFMEMNNKITLYTQTLVVDSLGEDNSLVQIYNRYTEKILDELKEENYEVAEVLKPYLKANLQEIMDAYRELNKKYKRQIGVINIKNEDYIMIDLTTTIKGLFKRIRERQNRH